MSSTLLRNMREKDLRKAIGYHMKKSQSLYDPKQKGLSAGQARINYLEELSELKSFGGKSFGATMMVGFDPRVRVCSRDVDDYSFCTFSTSSVFSSSRTGSRW